MMTLITAVFLASLLGSLHCVGMCGAFLATIASDGPRYGTQLGYHGGRLLTYLCLGAIAGAIGQGMNVAGTMAGLQPIASTLSASAVVVMGVLTWMRLKGIPLHVPRGSTAVSRFASHGYRFAMRRPPVQRAVIVGLLTTLLPCGWLWTFLITAGGTGRPSTAAGTMFVFWLGTLPAMAVFGAGLRGLLGAAQRRVPTVTCLAMIGVGLFTIAGRWRLDPAAWAAAPATQPAAQQPVQSPPCCEVAHARAD
jgi:sulfite exporter TauE/SafE